MTEGGLRNNYATPVRMQLLANYRKCVPKLMNQEYAILPNDVGPYILGIYCGQIKFIWYDFYEITKASRIKKAGSG